MRCKTQGKVQYHNKRLAEKAMLSYYLEKGAEAFGSYQCPFCTYWHITSEYDNRSPQIRHEFRQAIQQRDKKLLLSQWSQVCQLERKILRDRGLLPPKQTKKQTVKENILPLAEQKKIYAQLKQLSPVRKPTLLTRIIHRVSCIHYKSK